MMAAVAEILSRQRTLVRQTLAVDPDALQDARTILVVEEQLTGKAIEKPSRFRAAKGQKTLT